MPIDGYWYPVEVRATTVQSIQEETHVSDDFVVSGVTWTPDYKQRKEAVALCCDYAHVSKNGQTLNGNSLLSIVRCTRALYTLPG